MSDKKKTPRFYMAMAGAKAMIGVLTAAGRNASHVPGRKAINFCPDFLEQIDKPGHIIGVTGTNGKTTVSNLIADVLQDNGFDIVDNRFGGNIDSGIASALIKNSTPGGRMKKDYAVLEVDERMTPKIFPYVKPDILVVTNLFRDSYRRNAHTEFIADILDSSIPEGTKLVLNGEDLLTSHLSSGNDRVCFGIRTGDEDGINTENIIRDNRACPVCGSLIDFDYIRYNNIGRGKCPKCGYSSLPMNYVVTEIDNENGRLTLDTPKGSMDLKLLGHNITDVYNSVTAVAALMEAGLEMDKIAASFEKMQIPDTRYQEMIVDGRKIVMIVGKGQNPVACSRVFDYISKEPGKKALILIIDDFYDRKDTSENIAWIFDTDFEFLKQDNITQIVVGGRRHNDFHLRLLMAGVPESKIKCCEVDTDAADLIDIDAADDFYIVHDIYTTQYAEDNRAALAGRIEAKGNGKW